MKAYLRLMPALCLSTLVAKLTGCALASSQGTAIRLTAKNQMLRMVLAQKEHYIQNQTFAESVNDLEGCVDLEECIDQIAPNYRATEIAVEDHRADSYAITTQKNIYETQLFGQPWIFPWQSSEHLYNYVGTVHVLDNQLGIFDIGNSTHGNESKPESQIVSIVCQAIEPGAQRLEQPVFIDNQLTCAEGSRDVTTLPL